MTPRFFVLFYFVRLFSLSCRYGWGGLCGTWVQVDSERRALAESIPTRRSPRRPAGDIHGENIWLPSVLLRFFGIGRQLPVISHAAALLQSKGLKSKVEASGVLESFAWEAAHRRMSMICQVERIVGVSNNQLVLIVQCVQDPRLRNECHKHLRTLMSRTPRITVYVLYAENEHLRWCNESIPTELAFSEIGGPVLRTQGNNPRKIVLTFEHFGRKNIRQLV